MVFDRPPLFDSSLRPKIYLGLCCFLLLAWGSWKSWEIYREKQQQRWTETAELLLDEKDWRGASVAARRSLHLKKNPDFNLRSTEVMAKICRNLQLPQEIYWRSELVRLQPDDFFAKDNLVQSSIRHNSLALAGKTLESIPPSQQTTAAFHRLMAVYALATQQPAYAEAALRQALKLDPSSSEIRLNLAKILLAYGPSSVYPEAQSLLDSLQPSPENQADILRTRIEAFKIKNQPQEALIASTELLKLPQVNFNDKVSQIKLLHQTKSPYFSETLSKLQIEAGHDPAHVYQLASWLRNSGLAHEALVWLETFPADLLTTPPMSILWAECCTSAQEWVKLGETLDNQDWVETESLRLAFMARARQASSSSLQPESASLLQKSLSLAKSNPTLSLNLGDLLSSWSWTQEAQDAWWQAARSTESKIALGKLFDFYKRERNLNGIWRVSKMASEIDPSDLIARNNFNMTSLILENGVEPASISAQDLYKKNPDLPAFASTYAFSLLLQNQAAEALKIFQAMPPTFLQDAGIAPYYVMALVQNKMIQEATPFRNFVQPSSMFKEELAWYRRLGSP